MPSWTLPVQIVAGIGMDGRNPYVGETITIWLRVRHSQHGVVTELDADRGDTITYTMTKEDGTVHSSGSLGDAAYLNGRWQVDVLLPNTPGVLSTVLVATIDGAVGKAKLTTMVTSI